LRLSNSGRCSAFVRHPPAIFFKAARKADVKKDLRLNGAAGDQLFIFQLLSTAFLCIKKK
jgi:hypothetical protein